MFNSLLMTDSNSLGILKTDSLEIFSMDMIPFMTVNLGLSAMSPKNFLNIALASSLL